MAIKIVNRYSLTDKDYATQRVIYCGRGSALGNPFPILVGELGGRDRVCDEYHTWFYDVLIVTAKSNKQLQDIYEASLEGDVWLECFCAPRRCHCETIKSYIESKHYHP